MVLRRRLRLPLSAPLRREVISMASGAAALLVLEAFGRRLDSDAGDLLAVLLLASVVTAFAAFHRDTPLAWMTALLKRVRRVRRPLDRLRFSVGVDFRGQPKVATAIPPLLHFGVLVAAVATALSGLLMALDQNLRELVAPVSYVVYLTALGTTWTALLAILVTMIVIPVFNIHDYFATRFHQGPRRDRRPEGWCYFVYFFAALICGLLLPLWIASAMLGITFVIRVLRVRLLQPSLTLLWLHRPSGQVAAIDWRAFVSLASGIVIALGFAVLMGSLGPALLGGSSHWAESMPLTRKLGAAAAWLAALGLAVDTISILRRTGTAWRLDPAAEAPTSVHVAGTRDESERQTIESLVGLRGWTVRFDELPQRTDVRLSLVQPPLLPAPGEPAWPMRVTLDQLALPELQWRIERRDEIQRRRILLRTLRRLLRKAARRRYRRGTGFWIAPHHWFIMGLSRDTDEEELDGDEGSWGASGMIGPYYHEIFPQPVRHYMRRICEALQIDLILLEDGIGFPGLRRVLKRMFEHYDRHDGDRRIEEMHLGGLGGIRVILHDYEQTQPLDRARYPEPDYEDVGRARVLHIFKDRGEDDELPTTPLDLDWLLLPAGPV